MPLFFQKPENALKRANEFIDVGKRHRAINVLLEVIKSRRHRTWQKIHEPIMVKYLTLCVELKKSHLAKEGLFHYRNICQHINIKSLEDVTRGYLQLAEEKTEEARDESNQFILAIDDLDNVHTPESILLSAVISKDSRERSDHILLTPWVKFLWESYKHCLELLRNNSRVERLYHDIAQKAFRFCVRYHRKTEFRKLCDNLRTHLGHIYKHQNQLTAININNPESQAMHLETRLVQLDNAILMELWQEAYKAIEDINGLMVLTNKPSKVVLMASYYQKLALVFWKSGNVLYHASSLLKYFHLSKELKRNITPEEIQILASKVVISILAIPYPPTHAEIDWLVESDENIVEKNHYVLANLLNLAKPPSRTSLIKDLVRFGIIQLSHPPVQELYKMLETDSNPVKLCISVVQHLKKLNEEIPDLQQYNLPIQDIAIVRLLQMISQVYISIDSSKLLSMVPFADQFYLESKIVESARRNNLQVRIDHRNKCLNFGSELSILQREMPNEGPHLQNLPNELLQSHISRVYSLANKCTSLIRPNSLNNLKENLKLQIMTCYKDTAISSHRALLERRQIIEERKEILENICFLKEEAERKQIEQKQQKLREAEMERIAREAHERNKQRILLEQSEMRKKFVFEKFEQLKRTEIGAKLFERLEKKEFEKIDPEEILSRELEKEKRELITKLRKQEKNMDHFERAKRLEEIPLLKFQFEEYKIEAKLNYEKKEEERINQIIEEHQHALQNKMRMNRITREKQNILNRLRASHYKEYQRKLEIFNELIEKERTLRLKARAQERKERKKHEWLIFKEEEEQQRKLDEKRQAEESRKSKLEEIEAKKRLKEIEVEEKMDKDKELQHLKAAKLKEEPTLSIWKPATSWREKQKREDEYKYDNNDSFKKPEEKIETSWRKEEERRVVKSLPDRSRSDAQDWRSSGYPSPDKERIPDKSYEFERLPKSKDEYANEETPNAQTKDVKRQFEMNKFPENYYGSFSDRDFKGTRSKDVERHRETDVFKNFRWSSSERYGDKSSEKKSYDRSNAEQKKRDNYPDIDELSWRPSSVSCRKSQIESEDEIRC